ncbi:hypothetical protein HYT53_01350 [Candidatus Woesearchaeota archaeon]|nr:hypothetical protein [Candidatus Woesearchaeota archaeon]
MVQFVFSPKWFWGKDIFIDAIGVFVLVLIAVFSTRYYKLNKNRNYLYLALSFYLISFSYLAKILTNFTVYSKVLETATIGLLIITYQKVRVSEILFFIGFFLYRLFALSGFYALYSVHEKQSKLSIFLMLYFMAIATYFSLSPFSYYVFYFASFILLSSITMHYYKRYKKNKYSATKFLAVSFGIIAISQIFFMFVGINLNIYVVAEIIQLIGYITLLAAFVMVLKHGREKNKG